MAIKGNIKPIRDKVLVYNMNFGEQKTKSGLIIQADDGKSHGIRPRWAQVYAKGPENNDDYEVNDWVLIEHGRWTRGMQVETSEEETITVRMVDNDCVLLYQKEQPTDVILGNAISAPDINEAYRRGDLYD